MNRQYFEKVFSNRRMQRFFDRYPGNEPKAAVHYQANIQLSEALYPVLSVFEVALRNSLNRELTTMFGTADWYLHLSATAGLKDLNREITLAQKHITKRGEQISADKIVAELTLGFWTRLLNAEYEKILWKDLRRAFPFIAKKDKTRHNVSSPINQIRNLRNRIFHHEPIAWNLTKLDSLHKDTLKVCGWLNKDLPAFINGFDKFDAVLASTRLNLA